MPAPLAFTSTDPRIRRHVNTGPDTRACGDCCSRLHYRGTMNARLRPWRWMEKRRDPGETEIRIGANEARQRRRIFIRRPNNDGRRAGRLQLLPVLAISQERNFAGAGALQRIDAR